MNSTEFHNILEQEIIIKTLTSEPDIITSMIQNKHHQYHEKFK